MKILRVQTSPRGENSESRKLGDHLIAKAKRIDPTSTTILRDVSTGVALPDLTWIGASFTDAEKRDANQVRALAGSEHLIAELEATDLHVAEARANGRCRRTSLENRITGWAAISPLVPEVRHQFETAETSTAPGTRHIVLLENWGLNRSNVRSVA